MTATRSVLHIDDDPVTTRVIGAKLRGFGIESQELNDPHHALEVLLTQKYRVVLLDIDMPQISGLKVLREIKRFDGGIFVIMLTGIVAQASVLQSLRWGAADCLFKPVVDVHPLVQSIERAFADIDRWHGTLQQLARLRRSESTPTASPAITLPTDAPLSFTPAQTL